MGSIPAASTDDLSAGWVGLAYVFRYHGGAYYGSGPSLAPSVMHALLWRAILECKARGDRRFELGWQGQARDGKGRGIEMFKRGFGGEAVPQVVWEWQALPDRRAALAASPQDR